MQVEEAQEVDQLSDTPPEDFDEYQVWREAGGGSTPAQLPKDPTPPADAQVLESVPPQEIEEGETAVESDPTEEAEQEEEVEEAVDPAEPEVPAPGQPGKGTEKRFKKLTGEIAALKSRLEELTQPEDEEEAAVEVASTPEPVAPVAQLPRPKLSNFEDNETSGTAWDQYEAAMDAYNAAQIAAAVDGVRAEAAKEKATLQQQHVQQLHAVAWSEAASRYPDFNAVVVNDAVKISPVMEAVMRMDPKAGTDVAYWLGQHPEESLRIANLTIADGKDGYKPAEYTTKMARAAMEIGKIQAKIDSPGKGPVAVPAKAATAAPPAVTAKTSALTPGTTPGGLPNPAPKPAIKKVSTASRPPTQLRAAAAPAKFDTANPDTASDYNKWEAQRNRELAARGQR
jgi:hypothetical protein